MKATTSYLSGLLFFLLPASGFCIQVQDTVLANEYLQTAKTLFFEGAYDSASYYAGLAGELYQKAHHELGYGKSLFRIGAAAHFQKKGKEALPNYLSALEILEKLLPEKDPYIGDLYNNIGGVYTDLGHRYEARKYLERALEIRMTHHGEDSLSIAVTHYNLGLSCIYFGENRSSLQHFMKAMPVYLRKYGDNGTRVAQLYTNVGILYRDLGDYDHAKDYFYRAIVIHLENHGEKYWNLAYPYANLGEVFILTGEKDLALEYYQKTLTLCEENPSYLKRLESIANGMLAKFYVETGEYGKSLPYAYKAIDIIKETYYDEHPRLNDYYRIIGDTYRKQGDFTTANQWFEKALENVTAAYGFIHPKLAEVYRKQADIYLEMKDYEKALQVLQAGIQTISPQFKRNDDLHYPGVDAVLDEKMYLHLIADKGQVFQKRAENSSNPDNDLKVALEHYVLAAEIIDHIRRGYLSESSKLFLQQNAVSVYEKAIAACYQLHRITHEADYLEKAFFFMEKSKASVLSEALQASELNAVQGVPSHILEKEKELNRYIKSLELQLADAQAYEHDSVQMALGKELFRAKISNDSLIQVIKQNHPDYHDLKYNMEVVSVAAVRDALGENTAMLSYFEGDSSWYVYSLSKHKMNLSEVEKLSLSSDELQLFREAVSNAQAEVNDFASTAYLIYSKIVATPLQDHQNVKRLIIVPDGVLGYLPFDALITQSIQDETFASKPHYLIEDYTVSYASSMTLVSQFFTPLYKPKETYVGFAPTYPENLVASHLEGAYRDLLSQLSGTQEEVRFAGNIFSGKIFLEQDATEYNFKNLGPSPAILHLAMHALVDDEDPMRSRLLFTHEPDSSEDGNLNAYEIYNLRLFSELAVLSACNTGYGEINRGEGILSLSRAFMYAGCPNIVMSLWKAKDQPTTQIVRNFFENLKAELPKDEALRQAKLTYLRQADPLKAHPAHWATFVLLGNAEPVRILSNALTWWIAGILLLFMASGTLFYFRNKKIKV